MSHWVRLWDDMPTDPKWRVVSRRSGRPIPEVLAVFVFMMTNAGGADDRGTLENWNDEDVAAALDMEHEHVSAIRQAMDGKTLDGERLTGWEKRQPKREGDSSSARVKAFREKGNAVKRIETHGNARIEEIREDKKEDASASSPRELADFKKGVMQAFQAAGSMAFPDTHRTAIWLERGWKPQICLAVIAEVLAKNSTITSLKYFDQPIADAHKTPEGRGLASPGYKSPIVDMKAGAVAVVEGSEAYSAWLSKSPAVLKHKRREEKVDGVTRWVAYLPTEYPPGHVPKLSLSDRKEDAA